MVQVGGTLVRVGSDDLLLSTVFRLYSVKSTSVGSGRRGLTRVSIDVPFVSTLIYVDFDLLVGSTRIVVTGRVTWYSICQQQSCVTKSHPTMYRFRLTVSKTFYTHF